jgi:hypothetical protein
MAVSIVESLAKSFWSDGGISGCLGGVDLTVRAALKRRTPK